MGVKYTDEELRSASNRVMKSMNIINSNSLKHFSKPAIRNSLGLSENKISKSSRKRHNKRERANLAGKKMENLLTSLPKAENPVPVPPSAAALKTQKLQTANMKRHHSRKAEQKVVQHEIASFQLKPLDEIRAKIMRQNRRD